MVSFFGLKLGSDRKKAQASKRQTKAAQTWDVNDQNLMAGSRDFSHNFSRPHFPSSATRPGTADSTRSTSNWRAVFKNPAMTSSMVDLAPPRRRQPSMSSLRHAASNMNLSPGNASPGALGGSGLHQGTPSRTATSKRTEWVDPWDMHVCKDSTSSRPGTYQGSNVATLDANHASQSPGASASPKNLLGYFDLGLSASIDRNGTNQAPHEQNGKLEEDSVIRNGYPSPPQSDRDSDRAFSPVNIPRSNDHGTSFGKPNPPSTLKMDVPGPTALPSPALSVQRDSEERQEGPIIRNVPARRDTMAFHQPRRGSFTMEFEGAQRATMMHPPKEGFSGNFADFDFGEIVSKPTSNASVKEDETGIEEERRTSVSSHSSKESLVDSMLRKTPSRQSTYLTRQSNREHSKSPAPTQASEDQVTSSSLIDQLPKPPTDASRRQNDAVSAPADVQHGLGPGHGPKIIPKQGFQSRFDSDTSSRAPPPRPLRPLTTASGAHSNKELGSVSPYGPPPDSGTSYMTDEKPPLQKAVDKLPLSPLTRPPMEGDFPVSKGLPRGRRPEPLQTHPVYLSHEEDDYFALPAWSDLDRSAPRRSAMPAPLTTARPYTGHGANPGISTPTSATAPRIPSPTFPSLVQSISSSSSTFGKTFEIDFDEHLNSPTLGGFPSMDRRPSTSAGVNSRRVQATKAPPRPPPVTLPPTPKRETGALSAKPPALAEISATFI